MNGRKKRGVPRRKRDQNSIEEAVRAQDMRPKSRKAAGPCWPGYEQVGMKRGKSGKMVPNCVPISTKSEKG